MVPHVQAQTNRLPVASALTTTQAPKRMPESMSMGRAYNVRMTGVLTAIGSLDHPEAWPLAAERHEDTALDDARSPCQLALSPALRSLVRGPSLMMLQLGNLRCAGSSASSPRPSGGRDAQAAPCVRSWREEFSAHRLFPDRVDDIAYFLIVEQ